MKETVNFCDFVDRFNSMGRSDNFSYKGKRALFDYLEDYEESTGEEMELDIIALCCEFSEGTIQYFAEQYEIEGDYETVLNHLEENTIVIRVTDDVIIIADY